MRDICFLWGDLGRFDGLTCPLCRHAVRKRVTIAFPINLATRWFQEAIFGVSLSFVSDCRLRRRLAALRVSSSWRLFGFWCGFAFRIPAEAHFESIEGHQRHAHLAGWVERDGGCGLVK